MSDEEALLAAVIADPDDDLPRLVYADWLDEHSQPDRAEFIRLQIERERTSRSDPRGRTVGHREKSLLNQYGKRWSLPFRSLMPGASVIFRRGFPADLRVPATQFIPHAAQVLRLAPLQLVELAIATNGLWDVLPLLRAPHVRFRWVHFHSGLGHTAVGIELLQPAPARIEPYLGSGRWLVLACADGSGPDRRAVENLFRYTIRYGFPSSGLNVAIRPFGAEWEFETWCPVSEPFASPHWLLLQDGQLVRDWIGVDPENQWGPFPFATLA